MVVHSATKAATMYEAYFHLQKRPFSATPDPTCVFTSDSIRELFDELILRAENGQGIGVLTAAAGTGKTLICRRLAVELSDRFTAIYLPNANFPTRRALLQSILFELGRPYSGLEEQELRLAVYAALKELSLAGRGAVLIVDETHLLSDRLLEELRLLANLAEGETPLSRVILSGQMSLEERLIAPALEALNQRVVCQVYLEPLTRPESIDYVAFRVKWAGGDHSQLFTTTALDRIAAACNGLPRCINQLCDHALMLACVQDQQQVTEAMVDDALLDLKQLPLQWNTPGAADSPLDELHDDCVLGYDDEVEYEDEDEIVNRQPAPLAFGDHFATTETCETVCFEVGDNSFAASEPAAESRFQEELIDDRYAALDVRSPRFLRTFEDAVVPENWLPSRSSPAPAALPSRSLPHWSPVAEDSRAKTSTFETCEKPSPDASVNASPALKGEPPLDPTMAVEDIVELSDGIDVGLNLDAEPQLVNKVDPAYQSLELTPIDSMPIEEQLGSSILEACREVRTVVDRWAGSSDGPFSAIDQGHGSVVNDDELTVAGSGIEYDVIEPEFEEIDADARGAARQNAAVGQSAAARYVPKPKYRHVFSTLRRRLGRGLGTPG